MSDFTAKAAHPVTGKIFECYYMDDYYGRHKYGVQFPNGDIYPESECPESEDVKEPTDEKS